MRLAAVVVLAILMAGCTQIDQAKSDLAKAQADAKAAKDRFDRVRSATIVRTEQASVIVEARLTNDSLHFDVQAFRGNVTIPRANLTQTPKVTVNWTGGGAVCDPLACALRLDDPGATVAWADGTGSPVRLRDPSTCATLANGISFCGPGLRRDDADVLATTSVDDVTS